MRKTFALLLSILLVACNLPRSTPLPVTDTPFDQPCYFNWATKPLPDLSKQIQASMESAGLKGVTVIAEAFGENCIDAKTNQPVSFGAMETDFRVNLKVRSLADTKNLGNLLEKILVVLDDFPPATTPGSQPGYVGIVFESSDQSLHLWFLVEDGKAAREKGLHGAALLEHFQTK